MKQAIKQKPTARSIIKLIITIYIAIFLVVLIAWIINLGWHAIHLYGLAKNLQNDPSQIQAGTILHKIPGAADDIGAIQSQLRPLFPIFNALQGLPGIGPYLSQVEPLLTYADGLSQAGKEISLALAPLLEDSQEGEASLSLPERVSQVMQSGEERFTVAIQDIDRADQMRSRIQPELLPDSLRLLYLKLDDKFEILTAAVQLLSASPQLTGANEAKSYLVLAQNRDELRATGGFISGIGLVTIEDGKILKFSLGDSYAIDDFSKPYPQPPEALKRFMLADYWVTRDANWSPDFPSAAQEAQKLYTLSTGIETQGVIAFNQLALENILKVIGAVVVPGTDEPVTAENVEEYMRRAWAPAPEEGLSEEWWLHRKDFMQLLGSVILEKVFTLSNQDQLLNLAKTVVALLDQGQMLMYFNDPSAQAALEKGGWDGGVHAGSGDYLYLVDSNVGFNKVDSVIQRSIAYQVDLSDMAHPTGQVIMTYQHTGRGNQTCKQEISYGEGTYQDMQERCYLDYWRLYVPDGTTLLNSTAQAVPADQLLNGIGWSGQVESIPGENGLQVYAGLLMLPIGKSTQVAVSYSLPEGVVRTIGVDMQEYVLRVQVQPGLEGMPFQLEINLPQNADLANPDEGWKSKGATTWVWQGILYKTTVLHLTISKNPQP